MADLSITAANVLAAASAKTNVGTAGATITAGQPIYEDPNDSQKLKPAQADTATKARAVGIALNGGANGQPIKYLYFGDLTAGATLVVGQTYVVSDAAAGGIAPLADLATGDFPTILGIAKSTSVLAVDIQIGGVAKA